MRHPAASKGVRHGVLALVVLAMLPVAARQKVQDQRAILLPPVPAIVDAFRQYCASVATEAK